MRTAITLALTALLASCGQASPRSTPRSITVTIRTAASAHNESAKMDELIDPALVDAAGEQVRGASYDCASVNSLWSLRMTLSMKDIKVLRVDCVDGQSYQITMLTAENKAFVKPWNGTLLGS